MSERDEPTLGPALGVIETASIARGLVVSDAMLKRAEVDLLWSRAITPGKHVSIVIGGEAEVFEALRAGNEAARDSLLDRLYLAGPHPQVLLAVGGKVGGGDVEAVGVVETTTICSTLLAADAACKAADVRIHDLELARGIGGKGFFTLTGTLYEVQAAVAAAEQATEPSSWVGREIIPNPHSDWGSKLIR